MTQTTLKEKIDKVVAKQPSGWLERAEWFEANQSWLDRSADIALRVLSTLDALNMSQKELAERIGVSPQQVSKIVKGNENLTLETISKLEAALGVPLIEVCRATEESEADAETASQPGRSGKAQKPAKTYTAAVEPLAVKEEKSKS
ncbi:MAG: helix-turn-helix domain-containing protein [Chlorobiaceae bacterium]|nr:helix-turn-helix domain-containing protein [Chlorobiaceae bacterium]